MRTSRKKRTSGRIAARAFTASIFAYAAYRFIGRWERKWGTDAIEARMPMPGDGIVPKPRIQSTRGITINATPAEIWPWLAQIGQGRGGFYSYESLERLAGARIYNADKIIPQLQGLHAGDIIRLASESSGAPYFRVAEIEPGRALALSARIDTEEWRELGAGEPPAGRAAYFSWTFFLLPADKRTTRLLIRTRIDWTGRANSIRWRVLEPVQFIMERAMLLGMRNLAQHYAAAAEPEQAESGQRAA